MKLEFGPKYFLKCVLTDSVNNLILKKIDFGLNGPDRVTFYLESTGSGCVLTSNKCVIIDPSCTVK